MLGERFDVLHQGDHQGNDTMIRVRLHSGREIFGLATKNVYGGEWDVGPTWNYLVEGDTPFLVDSGRRGLGLHLLEMIDATGRNGKGFDTVVLSHGHEDHDGGLIELVNGTDVRIMAHKTYERLIGIYPSYAPSPEKRDFPASCWHCPMPESFSIRNCLEYHQERLGLKVDDIEDSPERLGDGISIVHVPGHAPDAVAILIDDEVMLAGDTILPDITPHPSREEFFSWTGPVLSPWYTDAQELYGLRAYLRSLKKLREIGSESAIDRYLPAHRLYYNDVWNPIDLPNRISAIVEHHIQRCSDILGIVRGGPKTVREICREHFSENSLKGLGINMAINEVLSHSELLEHSHDVSVKEDGTISATGPGQFESLIRSLM